MVAKQSAVKDESAKTEPSIESEASQVQELEAQLVKLQQECTQKDEAYKRVLADYQNLRRQTDFERVRLLQAAGAEVIESILPVYDHLEMALAHLKDPAIKMICDELKQALERQGLETITIAEGQEFDHESMEVVDTQPGEDNAVLAVAQAGYKLNGRVIRHAKVIVGKKK